MLLVSAGAGRQFQMDTATSVMSSVKCQDIAQKFFLSARRELASIVALCEPGRNKADGKEAKQAPTLEA